MSRVGRIGIVWLVVCLLIGVGSETSMAQADDVLWSDPVNLSRSGAAGAPVLVVSPKKQMQVFWWDRFDGITTSYTAGGGGWIPPKLAPLQIVELQGEGARTQVVTTTVTSMPQIVGADEQVFALWLGTPEEETEVQPLLYSRLRIGTAAWSAPERLAESATAWEMTRDSQSILHLIYVQPQQAEQYPAGIYYRSSVDEGVSWSAPMAVYTSLYVRLWTMETAYLSVAADGRGNVIVGWDDPRQERAFYALSTDEGASWRKPREVEDGEMVGQRPRFVVPTSSASRARSEILLLWEQRDETSSCVLMQQRSGDGGETWSVASRALEDVTSCPEQIAMTQIAGGQVLATLGEGTGRLLLAAWNGTQWSDVKPVDLSFENPVTSITTYLETFQANVMQNSALVVAGQGEDGEIWALRGQVDAVEWAFAPPSPWSNLAIVSESEGLPGFPAVATDSEGHVHVVWSAASAVDRSGAELYHSRWDETSWSRPVAVLGSADDVAQAPTLAYAGDFLHAVWSGGPTGTVFYSRAYSNDAHVASSWSAPQMLGEIDAGGTPAMTVDLLGRLHVVYAVSLNEGRGIYYTRTDDNGESWSDAVQILDAVAEHWSGVNHPSVTVDEQGAVHTVWVRAPLPGYGPSQGIYYSNSIDHGETWAEAVLLTDADHDWPQIVSTLIGQVVVTWQDPVRNIVQYRESDDYGLTWDYVSQVPGFQAVAGRSTLVSDNAGSLHVVALNTETGIGVTLLHSIYTEGQWSRSDSVNLEGIYAPVDGAVPSVAGEFGLIDAIGVGNQHRDGELVSSLWHTRRSIETGAVLESSFAPEVLPTPTLGPTPTPLPTPRPTVISDAPQTSVPVVELGPISLPVLALGGIGVALLLVGGAVMWKVMQRR